MPLPEPLQSKQNKTILELPPHERCLLLLHTIEFFKCGIYIFDEITREMPQGIYVQLKDLMTRLARQGRKSLCLSSMLANPPFEPETQGFYENIMWEKIVEEFRAQILKRERGNGVEE